VPPSLAAAQRRQGGQAATGLPAVAQSLRLGFGRDFVRVVEYAQHSRWLSSTHSRQPERSTGWPASTRLARRPLMALRRRQQSPQQVLQSHGLSAGQAQMLDPAADVTVTPWRRNA